MAGFALAMLFGTPTTVERNLELSAIADAVQVYSDAMRVLRNLPKATSKSKHKRGYYQARAFRLKK